MKFKGIIASCLVSLHIQLKQGLMYTMQFCNTTRCWWRIVEPQRIYRWTAECRRKMDGGFAVSFVPRYS